MKKKTLIIDDIKKEEKKQFIIKLIILLVIFVICVFIGIYMLNVYLVNKEFSEDIAKISKLNTETIFSIDRIYMYSSADAKSNETNKPIWDLDIFQYTDIALYINNREEEGISYENTIKSLTIDNIKFNGLETGTASLYYKNVNDFGKLSNIEENKIDNSLNFNIINSGEVDYTKPELYSNCQNPITLEYVNSNMKEETKISDISSPLIYDGSLLKKGGILLNNIKCTISFRITIINYYNQKFVATAYIDVPLEDTFNNNSIYDGKIIKNIENTNIIKFIRVE